MKKLLAACIVLASHVAFADPYHAELNEGFSNGNIDIGDDTSDKDQKYIGGSYYFSKVATDKGPLGEAAFLAKASSVSALFGETKYEDHSASAEFDDTAFGVHIVAESGLIVDFDYISADNDEDHHDVETLSLGAGTYIGDHHAIVFSYGNELDEDSSDYEISTERYNLNYRSVLSLSGDAAIAVDADLAYVKMDFDNEFDNEGYDASVGVTYYPIKKLGLEAIVGNQDVGEVTTKYWSVGAEYFIIDNFAVSLAYQDAEEDDDDVEDTTDFDAIFIGATARF
jgi:hypothetical protein